MLPFPEILLRLSLSLVLGAIIGFERESNEHEAGMRTNALIALGCALFTVISSDGFVGMLGLPHVQLDPTRIASYVIAGIGFLGGGAIFVRQDKERVKGLTTAAAIWVVAAIGMACGAGLYWVAVLVTAFALIVLIGLRMIEQRLLPKHPAHVQAIHLEVGGEMLEQLVSQIYATCTQKNVLVKKIETRQEQGGERLTITCHSRDEENIMDAVDMLRGLKGVQAIRVDVQDIRREYIFAKDPEGS